MSFDLNLHVRVDLSPALSDLIDRLARALGGRGLPPLTPYRDGASPWTEREPAASEPPEFDASRWSEERLDLLDRYYGVADDGELLTAINAMSGEMVSRSELSVAAERPKPAAIATNETATAEPKGRRWTEERDNLLIAERAAGWPARHILPLLNALPGRTLRRHELHQREYQLRAARLMPPKSEASPEAVELAARLDPVSADPVVIGSWAIEQGLCQVGDPITLQAINERRITLGLPAFARADEKVPHSPWPFVTGAVP